MVTGIETAGLVLAAFPLIIKGMKSWMEGVETLNRLRKARSIFRRYAVRLQCEHAVYRNTLYALLDDIVISNLG